MVIPLGPGMGGPQTPAPPAELARFKPMITAVAVGYLVTIIVGIYSNSAGDLLNNNGIFVFLAAASMVINEQQCFLQCIFPFALFASTAVVFDIITFAGLVSQNRTLQHPGFGDFFSDTCDYTQAATLTADVVVNNQTFTAGTEVMFTQNLCSQKYLVGHVVLVISWCIDVLATALAVCMVRALQAAGGGGSEILMQGLQAPGGDFGGGGDDGGYSPPPSRAPGGAGPGRAAGQPAAFQGVGQTLGS